ncbi:hypothetical protein LCGC14_2279040, partial [marine sediment metagenome]
ILLYLLWLVVGRYYKKNVFFNDICRKLLMNKVSDLYPFVLK